MMNEKARELGCKDTWFITPKGLDAQETDEKGEIHTHSTTAKIWQGSYYTVYRSRRKKRSF